MWRNIVVKDFVDWLHAHNRRRREDGERQTGFYGLDLYSLHRSMQEVIAYLENIDPVAARSSSWSRCNATHWSFMAEMVNDRESRRP